MYVDCSREKICVQLIKSRRISFMVHLPKGFLYLFLYSIPKFLSKFSDVIITAGVCGAYYCNSETPTVRYKVIRSKVPVLAN
jgi:hypothetical protein